MALRQITLSGITVGLDISTVDIYHTSVSPPNLIASGVTKSQLLSGYSFYDDDTHNTYVLESDDPCGVQTTVTIGTPSQTPTSTSTQTPTITATITSTPGLSPTTTPTNTVTSTITPTPDSSPTTTPTTTNTLTPTNTVTPTSSPQPSTFNIKSSVDSTLSPISGTVWYSIYDGFYLVDDEPYPTGQTWTQLGSTSTIPLCNDDISFGVITVPMDKTLFLQIRNEDGTQIYKTDSNFLSNPCTTVGGSSGFTYTLLIGGPLTVDVRLRITDPITLIPAPINVTPTPTRTQTPTNTLTPTNTVTQTSTTTPTNTVTPTQTVTRTATITPTNTVTPTPSPLPELVVNFGSEYGSGSTRIVYTFTASTIPSQNVTITFDNILYDKITEQQVTISTGVTIFAGSLTGRTIVTLRDLDYSDVQKGSTSFVNVESTRVNTTFNKYTKVTFEDYTPITGFAFFEKCCDRSDPGPDFIEVEVDTFDWVDNGGGIFYENTCYKPLKFPVVGATYIGLRYGADFFGECTDQRFCSCYTPPSATPTRTPTKTPT